MKFLGTLSLVYRFALLISCVLTGFAIYGVWSFKTLNELKITGPTYQQIIQDKNLVADILPPPAYIIESYLVSLQLAGSEKHEQNSLIQRLKDLQMEYSYRYEFWKNAALTEQLRETFLRQAHEPAILFYDIALKDFVPALQAGNREAAATALSKMELAYENHRSAIDQVVQIANRRVAHNEAAAVQQIGNATQLLLVVLALTVILTIAVALMISRSVSLPLSVLQKMMLQIKNSRDFTLRLDTHTRDEIGATAQAFNDLIMSLHNIFAELLEDTNDVSQAAQSLSTASTQAAVSSRQQSAAAATIASTIEQVNANINQLTDNAQVALDISCNSGALSHQGGDIIHHAAAAMLQIANSVQKTSATIEALGQQSLQISSVVQVIKAVADQTNLLALNAAIEAARAGEQGRGFAVVADEVRNLAKRTTNATEEISQMIESMQKSTQLAITAMGEAVSKADQGALIAHQAGDAINGIQVESSKVVEVVNTISASLIDQNKASNDIANNIEQVAEMAGANNAVAEQTAQEARHLEALAGHMRKTVGKFRL